MGALAGLSGALPTTWSALHNWHKSEQRALVQPFHVIILGAVLSAFSRRGLIDQTVWLTAVIALLSSIISAKLGIFIFQKLSESQFRQILLWLILTFGVVLLSGEFGDFLVASF